MLDDRRSTIDDGRSTGVAIAIAAFFAVAYVTTWALDGLGGRPQGGRTPLQTRLLF